MCSEWGLAEDLFDLDIKELTREILHTTLNSIEEIEKELNIIENETDEEYYFTTYSVGDSLQVEVPYFDDIIEHIKEADKSLTIAEALINHMVKRKIK